MKRVRPFGLLMLANALIVILAGLICFRRHEKELEERAEAAIPQLLG